MTSLKEDQIPKVVCGKCLWWDVESMLCERILLKLECKFKPMEKD